MKKCNKCKLEKELIEFYKNKTSKDGYRSECKLCKNSIAKNYYKNNKEIFEKYSKDWRNNNKEYIKEYNKTYNENNKEYLQESSKKWRDNNKEAIKEKDKIRYANNKETIKERSKKWREENSERKKETDKEWRINNKEKKSENSKKWSENNKEKRKEISKRYYNNNKKKCLTSTIKCAKNRKLNNPIFALIVDVRRIIYNSLYSKGYTKKSRTYEILGCTYEEFQIYIQSQFESWMDWNNHGIYTGNYNETWQYDHIKPLSSATTEKEVLELNHYTNFKPLCSKINLIDKGDKIDYY